MEALHLKYKACPHLSFDSASTEMASTKKTVTADPSKEAITASLTGLQPYSEYKMVVKALDNGGQTVEANLETPVETLEDRPLVRPLQGHAAPQR